MTTDRPTKMARYRSYQVMMAALGDEARVLRLSNEEVARRSKEIFESCFETEAA